MQTRKLLGEMVFKTQESILNRDNTRTAQEDKRIVSHHWESNPELLTSAVKPLQYSKAIYTLPNPIREDYLPVLCCK